MICLVFCLAGQSLQLPAPQLSNSIPDSSLPDDQDEAGNKDEDYYYYADYDPSDVRVFKGTVERVICDVIKIRLKEKDER